MLSKHQDMFGARLQILCETRLGHTSLRVFEYVCMQWLVYYSAYLNKGVMNSNIFTSQADM